MLPCKQRSHSGSHRTRPRNCSASPYGDGAFTVRLYNIALEHGYQLCDWSTDTRDWTWASASIIVKRVVHGDRATPRAQAGDRILMHLNNTQTRNALSRLIKGLRARGLTFDQLR